MTAELNTAAEKSGLRRIAVSSAVWIGAAGAAQAMIQLVALLVLARMLGPAQFGLFVAAVAIANLCLIFADFGISAAIVQRPTLDEAHTRTAFALSVLFTGGSAGALWTSATLLASSLRMPDLVPLLQVLAGVVAITGLASVAQGLAQRDLRLNWLAAIETGSLAFGFVVLAPLLAWHGAGVWALIGAYAGQQALRAGCLLCGHAHPRIPRFAIAGVLEILRFGSYHVVARLGNFFGSYGDKLVVGRFLGAPALGLYGHAMQIMTTPPTLIGQALDRVLFPTMARAQADTSRLGRAYLAGVALCALVTMPLGVLVAVLADEIVLVLLGPAWIGVTGPLRVLALGMLFRTSYKIGDSLARATGAVSARAWRQLVYALAVVVSAWAGHFAGLAGVAFGVCLAIGLNCLLMTALSLRLTGLVWRDVSAAHLPGVTLAAWIGAAGWLLATWLRMREAPPLLILVDVTIVTAGLAAMLAWRFPEVFLGSHIRPLLGDLRRMLPVASSSIRHPIDP